jgi:hypothetical protein
MEQALHGHDPDDYGHFLNVLQTYFNWHAGPLFTTDVQALFDTFLAYMPSHTRQHYNCHACRHFVDKFGSLVAIQDGGFTIPVMWPLNGPALYMPSMAACRNRVARAKVTGVFLHSKHTWGKPVTGPWHHMSVTTDAPNYHSLIKSAGQAMAEKREDFVNLSRALASYSLPTVEQAVTLLQSDVLYRSEKVLGVATWLEQVHCEQAKALNGKRARNLLWRAAATAPVGYCHVRSTMIGTLLDDIQSGMSFDRVRSRFAAKMHPLQYQRPQARPTRGNIERAEHVVKRLGIAASLRRRYATLDDVELLWSPHPMGIIYALGYGYASVPTSGVFDHVRAKEDVPVQHTHLPSTNMTWVKFCDTVLPDASKIELLVPHGPSGFGALTTASDPTAPPILQWDNPVAWYVYSGGSTAQRWGLRAGHRAEVTGICLSPTMWQSGSAHHGKFVMFLLAGAADKRNASLALFPETLKADLHEVRSTIEAFSRAGRLDRVDRPACGLILRKGQTWNARVRVTTTRTTREYVLDRWD